MKRNYSAAVRLVFDNLPCDAGYERIDSERNRKYLFRIGGLKNNSSTRKNKTINGGSIKMYENRKYPKCGAMNEKLDLKETDGLFVCGNCQEIIDTKNEGETEIKSDNRVLNFETSHL